MDHLYLDVIESVGINVDPKTVEWVAVKIKSQHNVGVYQRTCSSSWWSRYRTCSRWAAAWACLRRSCGATPSRVRVGDSHPR